MNVRVEQQRFLDAGKGALVEHRLGRQRQRGGRARFRCRRGLDGGLRRFGGNGRLGRRNALRQRRPRGKRQNDPGNRDDPHQFASPAPLPYWYGGNSTSCRSEFCRVGDSIGSKSFHHLPKTEYIGSMTKLLDQALEAVRDLPPDVQDDIARIVLELAGSGDALPVQLSDDERAAIAHSKTASARSEFASDQQVRSVWAKHGL